jgi:hypothetical protein
MHLRQPTPLLAIAGCAVFPASSPWNQRVDKLPVHAKSGEMVRAIGADASPHPDFGSGLYEGKPIGIPYNVVKRGAAKRGVRFEYADESDKGPYPIPAKPKIEGGGDRHVLMVERGTCKLYELFAAAQSGSSWTAGSGAIFNLRSNRLRPKGWTSADAAGLPIFPGLARYDEVKAGAIRHALRFTVPRTRKAYVYPARHYASSSTDPSLPRMGERVRLKASVKESRFGPQARVIVRALKRYGMLLADNGSPWFLSGAPNPKWDNDDLRTLKTLQGSDFEVVDTSSLPR